MGACVASVGISSAGCLDLLDDSDDIPQGSVPDYAEWIPAELVPDDEKIRVVHVDTQDVGDVWPRALRDEIGFESYADEFGFDLDNLESLLVIETEAAFADNHSAFLGDFDEDAIVEHVFGPEFDPDTYGDYYVIGDDLAIGDDGILFSVAFEDLIDAAQDDIDRAIGEREYWERAVRAVESPEMAIYNETPEEPWELLGMAVDYDTTEAHFELEAFAFFEIEATAEEELEYFEDEIAEDIEEGEIDEVEQIGNVVVVRATAGEDFLDI